MEIQARFKRIVLKISGEALAGNQKGGFDFAFIDQISRQIVEESQSGVQIAIVVGGGNIWRGRQGSAMDRTAADHMGMLATVINALALRDSLEKNGAEVRVQTAIEMRQIAEPYIRLRALHHLDRGRVVLFACGTGNPYFTTDTTAALRAAEIDADAILLAKNVDAVYTGDPRLDPLAERIEEISYIEVLNRGLTVMDTTALTLCMDNHIPILVFGLSEPGSIHNALSGAKVGTIIR